MNNRKKFILVDGQGLLYRAFYALPQLTTTYGQVVNAVYGFTMILIRLLEEEKPEYMVITFDTPVPTFRHKEFKEYKAHRKKMPDELISQIPLIKEIISNYNISSCSKEGYEADDVIGTIAKEAEKRNCNTIIVTGDKDAFQLISPHTKIMTTIKGVTEVKIYDEEGIKKKFGVGSEKIVDILALKGDSSDNIPGVPGIGEKTAIALIKEFGNLENILNNADKISKRSLREAIREYEDQIKMSKMLATIVREVPIKYDFDSFRVKSPNYEELWKIFKKLEFKNLLKKIAPKINHEKTKLKFNLIDTEEKLERLTNRIIEKKYFSFYIINSSDNAISSDILGIALSFKDNENYYIPLFALNLIENSKCLSLELVLSKLRPYFENQGIIKISHNLKFNFIVLCRNKVGIEGNNFDTMIAAYLLNPSSENYNLRNLFWEYLKYFKNNENKEGKQNTIVSIVDACENAQNILKLKDILEEKMEEKNLISLFRKIEMPLVKILGEMEINGIKVNIDFLKKMSQQVDTRLGELKKTIYNLSGTEFNINSPKQLSVILFERLKLPVIKKTKTGYSTNADVLNTLAPQHKVVSFILEYRELGKLKNTYIDKLPFLVNSKTKRIHTSFHQTVTSTGRLSSSEPNLQNIPIRTEIGKEIRKAFIAEEGFVLLSADYSQIELRILAHLSQDESLLNAFKNGEDIHAHTASGIFGLDQNIISKQMRRMAKVINFGIIYGMSSYGLARNLGIGREEAEKYINNYFYRYQGVKKYIEREKEEARKKGYVITLLNRRRYLEGINSNDKNIREFNERIAINAPIQGSAADLIKLAMIKIDESFKKERFKSKLLLQIHDELIFEVYKPELEKAKDIIKDIMEHSLKLSVPIKVNLKTGSNWAEVS
ncbi:MAG TPA: DNA polymerase I [Candidatus Atribacteria bacterium]|nr:MAG: DNA polymerase [Atribacteria bacterium 34_128]HAJ32183.1 DNA polymerase I [Candidatus Atribacteria bacterium]